MKLTAYHTTYRKLESLAKKETDVEMYKRYRVIMALARQLDVSQVNALTGAARSTINRLRQHFVAEGIHGLRDRRRERSAEKVTPEYVERLIELLSDSPRIHGWQRSTWTRELLGLQMKKETTIGLHRSHVGRLLYQENIRYGRARPVAKRWMSAQKKAAKMRNINALLREIPRNDVVIYEDEVDIHLNPKIGSAWMPEGDQMEIETPGQNQKRYLFGGLNAVTGQVTYTESTKKRAAGFIEWLVVLSERYRQASAIHIICDNYVIHKTAAVKTAMQELKRIRLHFLPAYCPDKNRIEMLWKQLHAVVTRNHQCKTIDELMIQVREFMNPLRRHGWKAQQTASGANT